MRKKGQKNRQMQFENELVIGRREGATDNDRL